MDLQLPFSFEDIFFGSGRLEFYMNSCDEETPLLAQIRFPEKFDMIVEHISMQTFTVSLYWDIENRCPPVIVWHAENTQLLKKALHEAVIRTEEEVKQRRFSYYGPIWETEFIEVI